MGSAMNANSHYDVIVIGAGIAGASIAAELSAQQNVLLLEAENQPGYHSTGRSAALFSEIYGPPIVRALSRASRDFLRSPPTGFSDTPLLTARGALFVATHEQRAALAEFSTSDGVVGQAVLIDVEKACALCPSLRQDVIADALYEPGACDIEVASLHYGYLRRLRANGGLCRTNARVGALERTDGSWTVTAADGTSCTAPVVVNAAGAWADVVACLGGVKPVGLQPMRRTAVLVNPPNDTAIAHWPMVIDIEEGFYFKPDAGKILLSPADQTPSEPCDAQPEEWDIAVAVDRVVAVANIDVHRVSHSWAGLRTFAPDRLPVVGFDPLYTGFFWLAGQGGYGVQTAPGLAKLASALITGADISVEDRQLASALSPDRFGVIPSECKSL